MHDTGFITGNYKYKEGVKFGVSGAVFHPAIDYTRLTTQVIPGQAILALRENCGIS